MKQFVVLAALALFTAQIFAAQRRRSRISPEAVEKFFNKLKELSESGDRADLALLRKIQKEMVSTDKSGQEVIMLKTLAQFD